MAATPLLALAIGASALGTVGTIASARRQSNPRTPSPTGESRARIEQNARAGSEAARIAALRRRGTESLRLDPGLSSPARTGLSILDY